MQIVTVFTGLILAGVIGSLLVAYQLRDRLDKIIELLAKK
jgi:hypothetical protein